MYRHTGGTLQEEPHLVGLTAEAGRRCGGRDIICCCFARSGASGERCKQAQQACERSQLIDWSRSEAVLSWVGDRDNDAAQVG